MHYRENDEMSNVILNLYSSGCARNSRTVPHTLGTPVISMTFPGIMDWQFQEVIETTDDVAMSIDFATLDNKWAYYVMADSKVSKNSWKFTFTMCGLKTHMMAGNTEMKGKWNRTPTWIDSDTITPAVSGYKRGREVDLPGLLPVGWVFVEISIRLIAGLVTTDGKVKTETGERNVMLGMFAQKDTTRASGSLSLKDIVYNLSNFNYSIDGGTTFINQLDIEQIENISYNRLCPYLFTPHLNTDGDVIDITLDNIDKTFKVKRKDELLTNPGINSTVTKSGNFLSSKGVDCTIQMIKYDLAGDTGNSYDVYDKVLIKNSANTVFFFFQDTGGRETIYHPTLGSWGSSYANRKKYNVIKYTTDPRDFDGSEQLVKHLYVYNTADSTFNTSADDWGGEINPTLLSGMFELNLTDTEKKFGIATVLAPQVMGVIERSQTIIPYNYENDNTGWYLNIDLPMNKIVIPSMKLPYLSDSWRAYQMREMEYDRNELSRSNKYANDKFWGDMAKGMANGALAGGFAGTHSAPFGLAMGGTQFLGTAIGATIDRQVETVNNQRSYDNTVTRMKTAVDSYYNSGYGYRMVDSEDYHINIAMPIDDMTNEVKLSGYSCTGNLTAALSKGFIQGYPEPNNTIKGTIRNLIVNELQSGVWII